LDPSDSHLTLALGQQNPGDAGMVSAAFFFFFFVSKFYVFVKKEKFTGSPIHMGVKTPL
jgi:hypothetical protein